MEKKVAKTVAKTMAETVAKPECQNISTKAQFISPKHLHQTTFET
jgi:hypothetical protein